MRRPQYSRHRVDKSQAAIIEAAQKAGWEVFRDPPCDLFCFKNGTWKLIESKNPMSKSNGAPRLDPRQVAQAEFCARTNTPYVTTPEEALKALGEIQ